MINFSFPMMFNFYLILHKINYKVRRMLMLVRNYNDKSFIKSYNIFFDTDSEYLLSSEEYYMYCYLYTNRMYDDCIRTNINIINDTMIHRFVKTNKNNISKIKVTLESLISKSVVVAHNKPDIIRTNTTLELEINPTIPKKYPSFKKISYSKLSSFKSQQDLFIYGVAIQWVGGTNVSYKKWGELLGCSERHAITTISNAIDREVIYKKEGRYYSENVQEVNTYSEHSFDDTKEGKLDGNKDKSLGNWYDWNSFINEDDIYLYLDNLDDKNLHEQFNKRMNVLIKHNKKLHDKFKSIINNYHAMKMEEEVNDMMRRNVDSIVVVNGSPVYYKDWNGKGRVEEYHYQVVSFEPAVDGIMDKKMMINNPTSEEIEMYKPIDGKWKYDKELLDYGYDIDKKLLV